jgi:TonB family protein
MDAVGHVLAERQEDSFPWATGAALACLLHGGILAAVLLSSLAHPPHFTPMRTVTVSLVQAGSLKGGAEVSMPRPPEPEKPKIAKPEQEEPPPPSQKAKLLPAKEREEKKRPAPAPQAPDARRRTPEGAAVSSDAGSRGQGGPLGRGGSVPIGGAAFDQPDFNYSYYVERMLVTMGANWLKPAQTPPTSPIIHFRILRDGTITDAEVERSSGVAFADRAALRAVLASSPLPPLPAEWSRDNVGVKVFFE